MSKFRFRVGGEGRIRVFGFINVPFRWTVIAVTMPPEFRDTAMIVRGLLHGQPMVGGGVRGTMFVTLEDTADE